MSFHVLLVCIGNVCRSPLAERLLAARLDEAGAGDRFTVTSAGVRAMRETGMHPESIRTLRELGGDPDGFVSRQLSTDEVESADLVLAATLDIRSRILEEAPRALPCTFTIREFTELAAAGTGVDEAVAPSELASHVGASPRLAASPSELVRLCANARGSLVLEEPDVTDPIGRAPEVYDEVATLLDHETRLLAHALLRVIDADSG